MYRRRLLRLTGMAMLLVGGAVYWKHRWRYITIHHSGSDFADVAFLRRVHSERHPSDPIDEIPYHFLIGNGQGIGLGEVVSTGRWRTGLWGAHVSGSNNDRNLRGIGICLIGNFQTSNVPEDQFKALVTLMRELMTEHDITPDQVGFHGDIAGEATLCPGQHFPRERLEKAITALA